MNKKDIAHFRRQLKPNNDLLTIRDIFNVYILKESSEIYHQESSVFALLEDEKQELFMNNFKKVLSGQVDQKLFTLKFKQDVEGSSQLLLHQALLAENVEVWTEYMLQIVHKMLEERQYEKDMVVTFIRGDYRRPIKRNEDDMEHENDTVYANQFILCSINQTETPKNELLFDYVEKEFKYNVIVDSVINMKTPTDGFLFPSFTDGAANVNQILYTTGKAYDLDYYFLEEVLQVEEVMTAAEDKVVFEEVVKKVAGEQINTATLSNLYEEVHRVIEESEEDETPTLDYHDVEHVLKNSGVNDVETEEVKAAFKTVLDDDAYELKAENVIPKYTSKSIKIKTKVADVSVSPQDLKYVRQVQVGGKLCLLIEVEENTEIEGFEMIPEALWSEKVQGK